MTRLDQLNPMQRYLVREFVEDYEDGLLSRRGMIGRVLHITGSVAAAATILTTLGVKAGGAQETTPPAVDGPQSPLSVAADDPRVVSGDVTFPGADGETVTAYQSMPAPSGTPAAGSPEATMPYPLVLVCHENRGLTDHIQDVARRFATNGYIACAIDLLSREGGTAAISDPSQVPALLTDGDPARHVADFQSAITYYATIAEADSSRIGMNGYCFGGGITWLSATAIPELKAAVPFYGPPPPLDAVPNIQAAVLGVYSDDPDDGANEGREDLEAALRDAGIEYQINIYPNSQHAFHNDTGQRYSEEAASAAWQDMLAWFETHLV
jgi:carboxymethylenebutenolidase